VLLGLKVLRDHKALKVLLALKEILEMLALWALKVFRVNQEQLALKVFKGR
jgi:hypothetical protein